MQSIFKKAGQLIRTNYMQTLRKCEDYLLAVQEGAQADYEMSPEFSKGIDYEEVERKLEIIVATESGIHPRNTPKQRTSAFEILTTRAIASLGFRSFYRAFPQCAETCPEGQRRLHEDGGKALCGIVATRKGLRS